MKDVKRNAATLTKKVVVVLAISLSILVLPLLVPMETVLAQSDVPDELIILLEKDRITETITWLFIGTDNRDWAKVKEVFAEQVLFDMTSLAGGEPVTLTSQEIVDSWEQGLQHLEAIQHQIGNVLVTVKGNEAEAFCYGIASHYLPNPSGQNTRLFVGSYDFHLVKNGQQWRIDQFTFNLKYIDGNPNLEGNE